MARSPTTIRCKATLLQPAAAASRAAWTFLVLPGSASDKLPTRAMTTVEGSFGGHPFKATLEPDGAGSHWLKVSNKLREAAGAKVGDEVALQIRHAEVQLEPEVPPDLRKALDAAPDAQALWSDITLVARRDWIAWIISAKRPETRARRINNACEMLASGKRRVCCFDRSGIYGKHFAAPEAAQ